MKNRIKKFITILLIVQLVWLNAVPFAIAEEVATSPTPVASETNSTQETQSVTPSETTSTSTETPSGTPSPTPHGEVNPNPTETSSATINNSEHNNPPLYSDEWREAHIKQAREEAMAAYNKQYEVLLNQQLGGTGIVTGNADNGARTATLANNNLAESLLNEGSAGITNSNNGALSTNNGSASTNTANQNNNGAVLSGLSQSSITGKNNNSFGVGDSSTATGDANATGTVITALNSNVNAVMVSEFNIVDDHVGNIILDFSANCLSGCGEGGLTAANTGNGATSNNTANADVTNSNNSFQNNDGAVGNSLVLSAESGNNDASYNTGGDSNITTGDANVAGNVLTFLNNNIAGNVVFSTVNIFGDLIGDIIFPESQFACCGGSNVSATNTGNGANSANTANASLSNSDATFQNNDATINNNLVFNAATGDNSSSFNTGGNSTVNTGQANVDVNALNIINSNITGGNMWLVLINHAGNWIGKIMGAEPGASYAGSPDLEFTLGPNGEVNASNGGNGAASTNTALTSASNNNTAVQNNTGQVTNTLNLSANTGGNDTKFNTGGNSNIQTGDANIMANLVNFVNNNITGGKLFVTVVNVFGSWAGDFVGPGQQKENKNQDSSHNQGQGGTTNNSQSSHASPTQTSNTTNSPNPVSSAPAVTSVTGNASNTFSLNNGTNSNTSNNNGNTANAPVPSGLLASAQVAGMNTSSEEKKVKKKITINLGWLVVIVPLVILGLIIRRIILKKLQ